MLRKILNNQYYNFSRTSTRFFATPAVNLEQDVKPKPFEEIPTFSKFEAIRGFLPGGDFYGKNFQELHDITRAKYGNIFHFPAIFGRPSFVFVYDAEDYEKVMFIIRANDCVYLIDLHLDFP